MVDWSVLWQLRAQRLRLDFGRKASSMVSAPTIRSLQISGSAAIVHRSVQSVLGLLGKSAMSEFYCLGKSTPQI